jgi:hypothetical protein
MAWYLINFINFTHVGGVCLPGREFGPVLAAENEDEEEEKEACVISGFRRGVNEICALLGFYLA